MSTFRPSNANQSNYEQNRRVVEPREVSQVYSKHGYDIRPLEDLPQSSQPGPIHGTVPPFHTAISTISGNIESDVVPVGSGGVSTPAKRPFWRTPRGITIFVVVVIVVAAAVVGGVVGGKKNNDAIVATAAEVSYSALSVHSTATLSGSTGLTVSLPAPLSTSISSGSPAPSAGTTSGGNTGGTKP